MFCSDGGIRQSDAGGRAVFKKLQGPLSETVFPRKEIYFFLSEKRALRGSADTGAGVAETSRAPLSETAYLYNTVGLERLNAMFYLLLHKIWRPLLKIVYLRWVGLLVKRKFHLLENISIEKDPLQANQSEAGESKSLTVTTMEELRKEVWSFTCFFMNQIYSVGKKPKLEEAICSQAEKVTREMTKTFLNYSRPGSEKLSLKTMMPEFPFHYEEMKWKKEAAHSSLLAKREKAEEEPSLAALLKEVKFHYSEDDFKVEIPSAVNEIMNKDMTFQEIMDEGSALLAEHPSLLRETFTAIRGNADTDDNQTRNNLLPKDYHLGIAVFLLIEQALEDCRQFPSLYNFTFQRDGEVRALYNLLNLYLHYVTFHNTMHITKKMRKVYFAASALHPLQDDLLDEGTPSELAMTAIERAVKGEPLQMEHSAFSVEEKTAGSIIELIAAIYQVYPIKKHGGLKEIFTALHAWQLQSKKQSTNNLSDEELLEISFKKGGYAFAFFGYLVTGRAPLEEFNHFYVMGAIFQLLDDLHDLPEDLDSESMTVWTRAFHQGEWADGPMNGIISLQHFFDTETRAVESFTNPGFLRRIEGFGIRYDIFRFYSMNKAYFSPAFTAEFESVFPVNTAKSAGMFQHLQEEEGAELFKQVTSSVRTIIKTYVPSSTVKKVI